MAENWFEQNAPAAKPAPAAHPGDWFATNAPDAKPAKPIPGMEKLGALPTAAGPTGNIPRELQNRQDEVTDIMSSMGRVPRLGGRGIGPDFMAADAIRQSLNQAGRGAAAVVGTGNEQTTNRKAGAADLIEGATGAAGRATLPMMGPAAMANPVGAARVITAAYLAGKAAKTGTEMAGGDEDAQRLAEDLGQLAGGTGAATVKTPRLDAAVVGGVKGAVKSLPAALADAGVVMVKGHGAGAVVAPLKVAATVGRGALTGAQTELGALANEQALARAAAIRAKQQGPDGRRPIWATAAEGQAAPAEAPRTMADLMKPLSEAEIEAARTEMANRRQSRMEAMRQRAAAIPQPEVPPAAPPEAPAAAPAAPAATASIIDNLGDIAPEHPLATANRAQRVQMITKALGRMAEEMGYTTEDLQQLKNEKPDEFANLVKMVSKTPLGTRNAHWWRDSVPAASERTHAGVREAMNGTETQPTTAAPGGAEQGGLFGEVPTSAGGGPEAPASPAAPAAREPHPADTEVFVPGEDRSYPARYRLVELKDIQASHNGNTFQPNDRYAYKNDRDYTRVENQGKVVEGAIPSKFKPGMLVTDNPDATNGPPVVDSQGNALGGNGRTMILQRVYAGNGEPAARYRQMLETKAGQYGLDPAELAKFKEPVLVREIADEHLGGKGTAQDAVTDLNKTGTAALRPQERIMADARRVSPDTLEFMGHQLESAGDSGTMRQMLDSPAGTELFHKLVKDGVITPQETAALMNGDQLTPAGKQRVGQLLMGRFFEDPAQLDRLSPSTARKVERLAAPLVKAEANGWDIGAKIRQAISLVEETEAHGMKTPDALMKQTTLTGGQRTADPEVLGLARMLKNGTNRDLLDAARRFAAMSIEAEEDRRMGPDLFGLSNPKTSEQAYAETFGKLDPKRKPAPKTAKKE